MKSLSRQLLDRAIHAMASAIEIYNKPRIPYRNESFVILAVNGWELLLKAKWLELHGHKRQSLYIYEPRETSRGTKSAKRYIKKTRSNNPFTYGINFLGKQLANKSLLNVSALQNIEIMLEFRDCATHFYNETPYLETQLYEVGAACVKNFVNTTREWFERETTEFDIHLMPHAVMPLQSNVEGLMPNSQERNFLSFLDSLDESNIDPDAPYSVRVNVELRFTRSKSQDAMSVKLTSDPSALSLKLSEEDIREKYPWDYAELTKRCRQRYRNFKQNALYHEIRKCLETDEKFARDRFLDPVNRNGTKKTFYNSNILTELDKHYIRDNPR